MTSPVTNQNYYYPIWDLTSTGGQVSTQSEGDMILILNIQEEYPTEIDSPPLEINHLKSDNNY